MAQRTRVTPAKLPDDAPMVAALATLDVIRRANLPPARHADVGEDQLGPANARDVVGVFTRPRRSGPSGTL